jgi:hypothetical protein
VEETLQPENMDEGLLDSVSLTAGVVIDGAMNVGPEAQRELIRPNSEHKITLTYW